MENRWFLDRFSPGSSGEIPGGIGVCFGFCPIKGPMRHAGAVIGVHLHASSYDVLYELVFVARTSVSH